MFLTEEQLIAHTDGYRLRAEALKFYDPDHTYGRAPFPFKSDAFEEGSSGETIDVKRGEDIFAGTDYPRSWDAFVGQHKAKEQLRVQAASAKARGARIEHTLIASGTPGIGKTTLATLLAHEAGVGFVQTTGEAKRDDFLRLIKGMKEGDVLLVDEIHLLTAGGRNKADWLLPYMTEGVWYTPQGAIEVPNVAIVGATTDVGRLPDTLISRFMCQPQLVPYTHEEAAGIALNLAERIGVTIGDDHAAAIGQAANRNPRVMRQILTQVRDLSYAYPETHPNLGKAFDWAGVSADGFQLAARNILLALIAAPDYTCSIDTIRAQLGEPGPLHHHEQSLLQAGLVAITPRGRKLTDAGIRRARQEINTRQTY